MPMKDPVPMTRRDALRSFLGFSGFVSATFGLGGCAVESDGGYGDYFDYADYFDHPGERRG